MATKFFKKIGIVALAVFLLSSVGVYIQHDLAQAYVRYSPAAQLNAGDIKSLHILNGTILGEDISSGASTTMNKFLTGELYATSSVSLPANSITDAMVSDTLTASNYLSLSGWFATTSVSHLITITGLTTASSTNIRASTNLRSDGTLTLRGITYTPPSADGTNGQAITTNGAGALAWSDAGVAKYFSDTTAYTLTGTLATTTVKTITLAPGDFNENNTLHISVFYQQMRQDGSGNNGASIQLGNGTASTTLISIAGMGNGTQIARLDGWITASSTLLAQLMSGSASGGGNKVTTQETNLTTYNANNNLYLSFNLRMGDVIDLVAIRGIIIEKY